MTVPILVLAIAAVMIVVEVARPGRSWPRVAGWWLRAALLNGTQVAIAWASGVLWEPWMVRVRPWSAERLGPIGGAVAGYLVVTFIYYWWHRWRHELPLLWRWFHQVHHSPQRIEVITSFYKHPLEILANGVLSSAIVYLLVGLGPGAATSAILLTALAELFYHWNVATPYWVGFLVQRPESHCIHHQEGVHSYNYADLPLWDMLFGTFRNPRRWSARCGFGPEGEHRLGEMLRGVDIAAATGASPAPRVFSVARGLETFSTRFFIDWTDPAGHHRSEMLTSERYARLRGPYNRRNIYGAALAYGPVLAASPGTRPLFEAVASYGLCGERPLMSELGIDLATVAGAPVLRYIPRPGSDTGDLPLRLEVTCR